MKPSETNSVTEPSDADHVRRSLYSRLPAGVREIFPPLVGLLLLMAVFFAFAPTFRQWVAMTDILENSSVR